MDRLKLERSLMELEIRLKILKETLERLAKNLDKNNKGK